MERKIETRDLWRPIEVRDGLGQGNRLVGYIAKFNDPTSLYNFDGEELIESIDPGAFTRTLRENKDIRALVNHDTSRVLGRTTNGTLRLSTDAVGLRCEVDLDPTCGFAMDAKANVKRGDVTGCSFGFMVPRGGDRIEHQGKITTRTLLDIDLYEVSPVVSFPAYPTTEVALRGRPDWANRAELAQPRLRELRRFLVVMDLDG